MSLFHSVCGTGLLRSKMVKNEFEVERFVQILIVSHHSEAVATSYFSFRLRFYLKITYDNPIKQYAFQRLNQWFPTFFCL